jgi:hypothetical protein
MGDDCGATSPVIPHPPFHPHQPPHTNTALLRAFAMLGIGCQQPWEKKLKKSKKKTYIVLCTLKCTKKYFFFSNNIVFVYLAFKFNKSHCSSDLLFLFYFEKIKILFAINAGIEPAFSVKFGNRTRIYIVLRESNPDCTNLREGDGRLWKTILWRLNFFSCAWNIFI